MKDIEMQKKSFWTYLEKKAPMAVAAAVLLFAVVLPFRAHGQADVHFLTETLQARYRGIMSISATFTQEFHSFGMAKPMLSAGRVYFKKPGRMKWIYTKGSADVLVSDGKTIWLFQPDLNQVVETSADVGSTLATDFLSGIGDLKKDFIVRLEEENPKSYVLELTPIEMQQNLKRLHLHVDRVRNMVVKTVVEDFFGNSTHVRFSNIEVNMPMEDSFFTFKPPPGASVVKQ